MTVLHAGNSQKTKLPVGRRSSLCCMHRNWIIEFGRLGRQHRETIHGSRQIVVKRVKQLIADGIINIRVWKGEKQIDILQLLR